MVPAYVIVNLCISEMSFIITLILLISNIVQKNKKQSNKAFIIWNVNLMLILGNQVIFWSTHQLFPGVLESPFLRAVHNVALILDLPIYMWIYISFFFYVYSSIEEKTTVPEILSKILKFIGIIVFVLDIIIAVIYSRSLKTGFFFTVKNGFNYYTTNYYIIVAFALIFPIITFVIILKNRRVLGLLQTGMLLSYLIFPLVVLCFDILYNLTISYALYVLIGLAIYMEIDIKQSRNRAINEAKIANQQKELTEMRIALMVSQIQPHFLYNALSSISYLCMNDPQEAQRATNEFSDYLKGNLRSINSRTPISFDTELSHVRNYLKIQQHRFDERMIVCYNIAATNFDIPALVLQTLVENAVRYGVEGRFEPTMITISSFETELSYVVTVEDDGPGFDPNAPLSNDRPHIGLSSSRSRLSEMVNGTMEIDSILGEGTKITIRIPKADKRKGEELN